MNEIEKRITDLVNAKVEEVLEKLTDRALHIRIYERFRALLQTAEFSDPIRSELELMRSECWFKLKESAQSFLDEELLEYIGERVSVNLKHGGIESLISDKVAECAVEAIECDEDVQQRITQALLQSVERTLHREEVSRAIESMIQAAFQQSLDRFANKVISGSTGGG